MEHFFSAVRRGAVLLVVAFLVFVTVPHSAHAAEGVDWTEATSSAAWPGRYGAGVQAFENKLWLMGGYNNITSTNDVWYSTDGANWTEATSSAPWAGRDQFGTVVFDNKLWILGGNNGSTYYNDVWYSSDGINWTEATSNAGWSGRSDFGITVYDGDIWIMGGSTGSSSDVNDVWYSSDGINWTEATNSANWSARLGSSALTYDNEMWLMGGAGILAPFKHDVWYSTDGINWTEATSTAAWSVRDNAASAVFDGKMWILGGNAGMNFDDVWYSTDGANWTEATPNPGWSARQPAGGVVYDNDLWIMGGLTSTSDVWYTAQNTYTLSFNAEGGSSVSSDTLTAAATTTVPAAPTRSGYNFENWNTASDNSGTAYALGSTYTMPASDTTLYAIWQAQASTSTPSISNSDGSTNGGSIQSQVANLLAMGNTARATELESAWPQLFLTSATSSTSVPQAITAITSVAALSTSSIFARNLSVGMSGSDVKALQQFLNVHGFPIAQTGAGSSGKETIYFGELTKKALSAYQAVHDVIPAEGYFGPVTRAYFAAHS